jgi:hypothetical protein
MELVWDSRASTSQEASSDNNSTPNNSTHGRKWAWKLTINNYSDFISYLLDYEVIICKQHCTAVVSLDTHL